MKISKFSKPFPVLFLTKILVLALVIAAGKMVDSLALLGTETLAGPYSPDAGKTINVAAHAPTGTELYSLQTSTSWSEANAQNYAVTAGEVYSSTGFGGGGGMVSFSISPYAPLWFVGTDMGILFRSFDQGAHWQSLSQTQTRTNVNSSVTMSAGSLGFSADATTIFFAPRGGRNPQRSLDAGDTWNLIPLSLDSTERISYWATDSFNAELVFAATTAGLYRSIDKGNTWSRIASINAASTGTFIDYLTGGHVIYHATNEAVYVSHDLGLSFQEYYRPSHGPILAFTGGRDTNGMTLALVDNDGENACAWVNSYDGTAREITPARKQEIFDTSGYIWVNRNEAGFQQTSQWGTNLLQMAENDSQTIYSVGGYYYAIRGTRVDRSDDAGATWAKVFEQVGDDNLWSKWPADRLEYSGVGLDIGYWDASYLSFAINKRNSSILGGSGFFFLHTSMDKGEHWQSPFTHFADTGERTAGKRWSSTGLEMTGWYRLKFHPANPQVGYGGVADLGSAITEDGGQSWRVIRPGNHNSAYDFAFNPSDDNFVLAATDIIHGWPFDWWGEAITSTGGIFSSNDRGQTWTRLTSTDLPYGRGYLSVAYDPIHNIIYAGSRNGGVLRSTDNGANWSFYNAGIYPGQAIMIPQIEIDPNNGNVYALLGTDWTGQLTETNNAHTGIYFLDVAHGATSWALLRGTVNRGTIPENFMLWRQPTAFAIDFNHPDTLWLGDYEMGQWLAEGIWKSTDRGQTWDRMVQFTHPSQITLDPTDPNKVYAGGILEINGNWGNGGALYSTDGGLTWNRNTLLPCLQSLYGQTLDPNDPTKMFYLFWGNGVMYGTRPELLDDAQAPSKPTPTLTPISGDQIDLSWSASTDNVGVVGYSIYRSDGTSYAMFKLGDTTDLSYQVTDLLPETTYYIGVAAYDAAGNTSWFDARSATTLVGQQLTLHGTPANQAIHLNWEITQPFTGTWHIDYYTSTAHIYTTTLSSEIRATTLTEHVQNQQLYTVTLNAMLDEAVWLSDTVQVIPTDILLYLPSVLR